MQLSPLDAPLIIRGSRNRQRQASGRMYFMLSSLRKVAVIAVLSLSLTAIVSSLPILGVGDGSAHAQTASQVLVEGNQRVDDDTIRAYLSIQPGQRYSEFDINESLKALFATGLFADVEIERRRTVLVVIVEENPVLNRVVFEGNDRLKDDALEAIILSKPRGVFTRAKVQNDTQRRHRGYHQERSWGFRLGSAHEEPSLRFREGQR